MKPMYGTVQMRLWRTYESAEYVAATKVNTWIDVEYEFNDYRDGEPRRVSGYTLRLAGDEIIEDGSPVRALWESASHASLGVGIETWRPTGPLPGMAGSPTGARRPWAYTVYPRLHAISSGTWVDPYGGAHPSLVFHSSDEGPDWGTGPYPVALDGDGNPERLTHPLTRDHAFLTMVTTMSPEDALAYTGEES